MKTAQERGSLAHAQGIRYQNTVAKKFTEWSGKDFHSTPASGSLHWSPDVYGDVMTTVFPDWATLIECKSYEDVTIENYLYGTSTFRATTKAESWWAQTIREANESNAVPMLVFKKFRGKSFVVIPKVASLCQKLAAKGHFYGISPIKYYDLEGNLRQTDTMVCDLDHLLDTVTPKQYLKVFAKIDATTGDILVKAKKVTKKTSKGLSLDDVF